MEDEEMAQGGRVPGQVCDRCRRRKIRCHGDGNDCAPCYAAGVVCVATAKLKRNRKRKGYYESEGIEQRRPELSSPHESSHNESTRRPATTPQSDLQLRPSTSIAGAGGDVDVSVFHPGLPTVPVPSEKAQPQQKGAQGSNSEPVVGHMGRLVSDDGHAAMFAGSSTGVHFISQAEQQLQMLGLHTEAFPSSAYSLHLHNFWGRSATKSFSTESFVGRFPSNAAEIIADTIDKWTPIYPIVHKPSVMEALQEVSTGQKGSLVIIYQLLSLLALGTIGPSASSALNHKHFRLSRESEIYYDIATGLLDEILKKTSLETLQSLVLMQLYLQLTCRYSTASHLGGVAVRMGQNLGLHRHSNRFKFDPLETELRRRVWWCQYTLDAFSSAFHGVPRLIRDQDVDTDLPTRVDHDLLSRSHVAFPLPGEATQVDTALMVFKLSRIVGQTLEKLYTTTQRRGGVSKIARLQAELDMWEHSLPGVAVADEETDDSASSEATFATSFLQAAFHVATIHVHRPGMAFTTTHHQFQASLAACSKSSAGLIGILHHGLSALATTTPMHSDALLVLLLYPNGAHMFWQAGLTLLFAQWKSQPLPQQYGNDNHLVQQCVEALRSLHTVTNHGHDDILQCAEVLEVLRFKTFEDISAPLMETDHLQWNVWDWPMASALELSNTLEAMPFDIGL